MRLKHEIFWGLLEIWFLGKSEFSLWTKFPWWILQGNCFLFTPFSNKMSRCPDMTNLCGPSRHIYICCTFLWFLVMFGDFWWDLLFVAIMCWLIGVHFISDHIRVTLDIHTTWHSNEQKVVHLPHQCSVDKLLNQQCWYMLDRAFK